MIKKLVIFLVVIILIYMGIVSLLPKGLNVDQHQWSGNVITAQEYIYEVEDIQNKHVILGTSLSYEIVNDSLPDNFFNMGLRGLTVYDGMQIVNSVDEKPKAIYIETNILEVYSDQAFEELVLSPANYKAKKVFPILRERFRTVGIMKGILFYAIRDRVDQIRKNRIRNPSVVSKDRMANLVEIFSNEPDLRNAKAHLRQLKNNVDQLISSGVCVMFFEMPIEKPLCNSVKTSNIRALVKQIFPPDKYTFINQPDCSSYNTTDGSHLNPASAIKFTKYFLSKIQDENCSPS